MSYPMDLDEYSTEALESELKRRKKQEKAGLYS